MTLTQTPCVHMTTHAHNKQTNKNIKISTNNAKIKYWLCGKDRSQFLFTQRNSPRESNRAQKVGCEDGGGSRRIWWKSSGAIVCWFPGCALPRSRRHTHYRLGFESSLQLENREVLRVQVKRELNPWDRRGGFFFLLYACLRFELCISQLTANHGHSALPAGGSSEWAFKQSCVSQFLTQMPVLLSKG